MLQRVENGDIINLVSYTVPTLGRESRPIIKVHSYLTVFKSGKVTYSINTHLGEKRFKHALLNRPIEGAFRGSYIIAAPNTDAVNIAIKTAKQSIEETTKNMITKYESLVLQHTNSLNMAIDISYIEY